MNKVNEQIDFINYQNEFNLLVSSIVKNGEINLFKKLCDKISYLEYYEKNTINEINEYLKKLGRLPSYKYLVRKNILPEIDENNLYSKEILNDSLDVYLNNCFKLYTAKEFKIMSEKILKDGIPNNFKDYINNIFHYDSNIETNIEAEDFRKEYFCKEKAVGFKTGVHEIDRMTGGFHTGTLNTILGYSGCGKTTWAVNIAYNAALNGYNTLYVSLEIPRFYLICDLLSRHSLETDFKMKLGHREIKYRNLNKEQEKYLFDNIYPSFKEKIEKHFIVADDGDILEYSDEFFENLFSKTDKMFKKQTGKGIDIIIIDHVQLLKLSSSTKITDTREIINHFVSFFRKQAINFINSNRTVCFILLSQTNRDGWKYASRHDGAYQLINLAEANELERSSNIVLSIYTNEAYVQSNQAAVMILKSRDGALMEEPTLTRIDFPKYFIGESNSNFDDDPGAYNYGQVFNDFSIDVPDVPDIPDVKWEDEI